MKQCDDATVWREWLDEVKLPDGESVADLAETVAAVIRKGTDPAIPQAQATDQRHQAEKFWGVDEAWFWRWSQLYVQLGDKHPLLLSWLDAGGKVKARKASSPTQATRRAS